MQCQYGQQYSRGSRKKCRCKITNDMCGFVYFCAPENRYKNTGGYENCVLRQKEMSKEETAEQEIVKKEILDEGVVAETISDNTFSITIGVDATVDKDSEIEEDIEIEETETTDEIIIPEENFEAEEVSE